MTRIRDKAVSVEDINYADHLLDKLITKAVLKKKSKRRSALSIIKAAFHAQIERGEYGCCNSCSKLKSCRMAPSIGSFVRINCPHYEGGERVEPWRGMEGW